MTMTERLLALAEQLAETSGKSLTLKRRAVSTAYYAVFHALAQLCADELLGGRSDRRSEGYERVYRSLEHGALKKAFKEEPLRRVAALEKIGNRVAELQSERIRSDYLPSRALYTKDQCLSLVQSAKSTVRSISALSEVDRKSLAVHLLFKNRPL
jgi:uncharacterized protein (UPF0332 family)